MQVSALIKHYQNLLKKSEERKEGMQKASGKRVANLYDASEYAEVTTEIRCYKEFISELIQIQSDLVQKAIDKKING